MKLVYADTSISQQSDDASLTSYLRCELYPNNEGAISRALQLSQTGDLIDPLIIERDGSVVWTTYELIRECER